MILSANIIEVDIKHASLSIWLNKGAITKETYDELLSHPKNVRVVKTGLLQRDRPELSEILKKGLEEYVHKLIEVNKIPKSAILEVVKDAVWIIDYMPSQLKFGDVEFDYKSSYELYFKYKRFAFYLEKDTHALRTRGVSNTLSPEQANFLNKIRQVMLSYLYLEEDKVYKKLHKLRTELEQNPTKYGDSIINNDNNLALVKDMISEFLST